MGEALVITASCGPALYHAVVVVIAHWHWLRKPEIFRQSMM